MPTEPNEELSRFTCTHCGASISAPAAQAGTVINCVQCGGRVEVPRAGDQGSEPLVVVQPPPTVVTPLSEPLAEASGAVSPASNLQSPVPEGVVQAVAVSSNVAADPAAPALTAEGGGATAPLVAQTPPLAAPSQPLAVEPFRKPRKKGPWSKFASRRAIVALSVLAVLAVCALAGLAISRDMKRAHIQEEVEHLLGRAETAYSAGDIAGAAQHAEAARKKVTTSPLELDQVKVKCWQTQSQRFIDGNSDLDKLKKLMANAANDLSGVRGQLENKKMLLGGGAENKPLAAKIGALLADLGKLEEKKKLERLRADLSAADQLYKAGKIDESAAQAARIGAALAEKPAVRDNALEARIEALRKRAGQFKEAQDARLAGGKNYAEAKIKLDRQLQSLDEKNEDLRPLANAITQLKNALIEEEKKSRALSPQEAGELRNFALNLASFDRSIAVKRIEGDTIGLEVDGKPLRLGVMKMTVNGRLFMEAGGVRFFVDGKALQQRLLRVFRHALALGEAMQKAGLKSADYWDAFEEAPFPSARRQDGSGKEYVFLGDRLYVGQPVPKASAQQNAEADFTQKAEALEKAVLDDQATSKEIRETVATVVHATYKEAEWFDHLRGEFIRRVIAENYLESIVPEMGERLKNELAAYRAAYAKISAPIPNFSGTDNGGALAAELRTAEGFSLWILYDQAADVTTFALKNPDQEKNCLFVLYDFPGKLGEFPEQATPKRVRMTHQAAGVIATYDPATQKMTYDQAAWNLAAALESPPYRPEVIAEKGLGTPAWAWPPHVLLVDTKRNTKSIITPCGKLDIQDFNQLADPSARAKAMDDFLEQMAHIMPTANYLHLFFRYFLEYVLDSPVPSSPGLIGCRAYTGGNVHQTVYQTLARFRAGHYLGECADLAELYMNVTRRQGKISYVLSLPKHAACGWVEKTAADGDYTFYVIDTGPPHIFTNQVLDKVTEIAYRAYDDDKTMRIDPKSLSFLFRFNNEPRRTPYWLSSRMFVDKAYGEVMERVQSYWHFHFYALGIKTMTEMIEKGDRVSENCTELAGLYQWVGEAEDSVKWTQEALKQLGPDDLTSRFSEEFRMGFMWHEEHNGEKAYAAVKSMIGELKRLEHNPQRFNYTSTRIEVMGLLENLDRPWEAWDVAAADLTLFANPHQYALRIEHAGVMTTVYAKMRKLIKEGKQPSAEEQAGMERLEKILAWFYGEAVFTEQDDDYGAILRKYACLGEWYAAKYGQARLVQELLKDGPFPDPAQPRNHRDRRNPEVEDWNWIRLSPVSYAVAIGDALNLNEPPEKWRKEEAVKLVDAMIRAEKQACKFGSLASEDTEVPSNRVLRAFLLKDWKDLEEVLAMVGRENWVRLNADISDTFGRYARFVPPEEFARLYRMFAKYVKVRTAYFAVIYQAFRGEAVPQALAAAKVALECWPGDEDMAREDKYLEQLAKKRLEAKH